MGRRSFNSAKTPLRSQSPCHRCFYTRGTPLKTAAKGRPLPIHNTEIAELFDTLADWLEIEDANPFRVRAYRNAARSVRQESRSMRNSVNDIRLADGLL